MDQWSTNELVLTTSRPQGPLVPRETLRRFKSGQFLTWTLGMTLLLSACANSRERFAGEYQRTFPSGNESLLLDDDGTFVQSSWVDGAVAQNKGTWAIRKVGDQRRISFNNWFDYFSEERVKSFGASAGAVDISCPINDSIIFCGPAFTDYQYVRIRVKSR